MRRQPERAIQQQIVTLLRSVGCRVYTLGTTRRKGDYMGTMMSAGLVDVLAWLPRHMGLLLVEVKAPGGRLTPEQREFRDLAVACMDGKLGIYYATGGLDAVIVTLVHLGLVKAESFAHYHATEAP